MKVKLSSFVSHLEKAAFLRELLRVALCMCLLLGFHVQAQVQGLPALFYNNPGSLDAVKALVEQEATPDSQIQLDEYVEIPLNRAVNFGTFIQGLLVPPESGTYYFYIAADNQGQFYLSSDATRDQLSAEPLARIAGNDCTLSRQYNKYASQKSLAVELQAHQSYYFECYHYDFGYDSNFSLAWATPSMGDVLPTLPIQIQYTAPYVPLPTPPTIQVQPLSQSLWEGDCLNLSVEAKGTAPLAYQWYKEGVKITDATQSSYRIEVVSTQDTGDYTVEISNEWGTLLSEPAHLEVRSTQGFVSACFYDGLSSLEALKSRIAQGVPPDERYWMLEYVEIPLNRKVNFGTQIRGFLLPPESGTYYFYVAADNDGQFYLSTDADPAHLSAEPLCFLSGHNCSLPRQYDKYPNQKSAAQELVAGRAYYFECYQCDSGYDSNFSLAWATPSMGDVLPTLPLSVQYISPEPTPAPTLSYTWSQGELTLQFTGTLQCYDTESDQWKDVTDQSPYTVTQDAPAKLYRSRS